MAALSPKLGQDLLGLVRADEIIRQNPLHILNPLLNDLMVVRAAVLPQQKLKNIDRHIGPLLDLLGQVLPDNLAVKILPELVLYYFTGALTRLRSVHVNPSWLKLSYRPLTYVRRQTAKKRENINHKHIIQRN